MEVWQRVHQSDYLFPERDAPGDGGGVGSVREEAESDSGLDPAVKTNSGGLSSERETFKRSGSNKLLYLLIIKKFVFPVQFELSYFALFVG